MLYLKDLRFLGLQKKLIKWLYLLMPLKLLKKNQLLKKMKKVQLKKALLKKVLLKKAVKNHLTEFYEPVEMRRGDSAYYDATMGHNVISVSDDDASILWVTSLTQG